MKKLTFIILIALSVSLFQACQGNKGVSHSGDSSSIIDTMKNVAGTDEEASSTSAANSDTAFSSEAAVGGMAEVALGKLALDKTNNTQIKDFANMMITDHDKANNELKGVAKKNKITLPASLDAAHQMKMDSLSKLSGKDFDVAYVNAMIAGHQKMLSLMQFEAKDGRDADLQAFAAKTTPVVKSHLDAIKKIHDSLK